MKEESLAAPVSIVKAVLPTNPYIWAEDAVDIAKFGLYAVPVISVLSDQPNPSPILLKERIANILHLSLERKWELVRHFFKQMPYPTWVTLWEERQGQHIPHNYFASNYDFERIAQSNDAYDLWTLAFALGVQPDKDLLSLWSVDLDEPVPPEIQKFWKDHDFLSQYQFMQKTLINQPKPVVTANARQLQKKHY